jgi:hypothetical protein
MRSASSGAFVLFLFLAIEYACHRPGSTKSAVQSRAVPLKWEAVARVDNAEAWNELAQCLVQLNFLPPRPGLTWYDGPEFTAPLLSLDDGLALWGRQDAVFLIRKDGLRNLPHPCLAPRLKPGAYCHARLVIQDNAQHPRYFHMNREGGMQEMKSIPMPASEGGKDFFAEYAAFGENWPTLPPRAASQDEIQRLMDYLEKAFAMKLSTHHKLRNLQSQDRLHSCLKAARAYERRSLFKRVSRLRAELQSYAAQRLSQAKSIAAVAKLAGADEEAGTRVTLHNTSQQPFYLEPDPDYPCFIALSCGKHKPRFRKPVTRCSRNVGGAVGVSPGRTVSLVLDQVYEQMKGNEKDPAGRCTPVLGVLQPIPLKEKL